uniref:Transporter n=1 Tax=Schistocephalus solidus TaxID=70667 RepID=A0A0X3P9P4_SCHSO
MTGKADSLNDTQPSLQNDWQSSSGLIADNASQKTDPSEENTPTSDDSKKEESNLTKREQWNKKIDFLIACTGYSIGLGNVWRFPYLCYKNGGGAFLLPYFISVFVVGIPMFLLEVSVGQLMSRGGIEAWNICPLLKGIGYSSIIIAFLINMYYNIVMAWTLFYLFASFTVTLPWSTCGGVWNTPNCDENITNTMKNYTSNYSTRATDPVIEYWERRVLGLSESIDDLGSLRWDLSLCLLLAWLIIFLCIFRGLKATSQVTYFTALSPYVLLIILFGRAVSLPGATTGLAYFISPNWTQLTSYMVWSDAGTQIFFSYAISIGSLPALGSFNDFHHNSFRSWWHYVPKLQRLLFVRLRQHIGQHAVRLRHFCDSWVYVP